MGIGIIGGTGPAGLSLALRLGSCGFDVVVGSRDEARSREVLEGAKSGVGMDLSRVKPGTNRDAASQAVVVVATPWDSAPLGVKGLEDLLAGKTVVSMANALLRVGGDFQALIPARGSAAQTLQAVLMRSHVVGALHHVPAKELGSIDEQLDADILICGDSSSAKSEVKEILSKIPGARVFDAGALSSAGPIESMTAVLLNLNIRYKSRSSIRIIGIES